MAEQSNFAVLQIAPTDDRYTVRELLRRATVKQLLLVLPWEVSDKGWRAPLDFEVLARASLE